jgi:hypothetical protein
MMGDLDPADMALVVTVWSLARSCVTHEVDGGDARDGNRANLAPPSTGSEPVQADIPATTSAAWPVGRHAGFLAQQRCLYTEILLAAESW